MWRVFLLQRKKSMYPVSHGFTDGYSEIDNGELDDDIDDDNHDDE